MIRRWILYTAALLGLTVFYLAYQGWMAWLFFLCVVFLPLLSLLLSLPAMLTARVSLDCGGHVPMKEQRDVLVKTTGFFPAPLYRGVFQVTRLTTGQTWKLREGKTLPTDHCGQLQIRPVSSRIYDYLGLFWLKNRHMPPVTLSVRPTPVTVPVSEDLDRFMAKAFKPKPGGGFSENHELRLYRPGDQINQIHWKLTSKTGKIIVRESLEPVLGRAVLTMDLRGTPEELDEKFGKLLWMGRHLLSRGLRFEIHILTGVGARSARITCEADLDKSLDLMLGFPVATEGTIKDRSLGATWQMHIGGKSDEA